MTSSVVWGCDSTSAEVPACLLSRLEAVNRLQSVSTSALGISGVFGS